VAPADPGPVLRRPAGRITRLTSERRLPCSIHRAWSLGFDRQGGRSALGPSDGGPYPARLMRRSRSSRLAIAVVLGAAALQAGCPDKHQPRADGGTAAPVDAGPPAPTELVLSISAEVPDAGTVAIPATQDERPLIQPAQALVVTTNMPVRNYRIRVFDEVDRAMVSDDTAEERPDGSLLYRIQLPEPLKTGHRYALVLDAQTGNFALDATGRELPEQRIEFQVAGEKEKPPPPPKPARRRR
jgi:hypothetical protein